MKNIKIDNLYQDNAFNYYILAETAFSHEGDISYLFSLIDSAFEGKVDGIKFQILLNAEESYSKQTEIFENFEKWKISEKDWIKALKYAKSKDLEVLVLPIDLSSLSLIEKNLNLVDAIEIHSICFNEIPFIRKIRHLPLNVILGVGGRTLEDIQFLLNELTVENKSQIRNIILMFGFQNFPTDYTKINLAKLKSLKERFKLVLGYADHTSYKDYKMGTKLIKYALVLGARIFEKHIILEKGSKRIDFETAVTYKEFLEIREALENLIKILGDKDLHNLSDVELKYRNREKQLIAKSDLKKGEILTKENIGYKVSRDKSDFEQRDFIKIQNKILKKDIKKDAVLKFEHINL